MDADLDVPPVSCCAVCGQNGCSGCLPQDERQLRAESGILFERTDLELSERFVRTTLESALAPAQMFGGRLLGPGAWPAFRYAVLSEALAIGSLLVPLGVALALLFPKVAVQLAFLPGAWLTMWVAYVFFVMFLLLVHWLWGLALDFGSSPGGARGASPGGAALRQGVRFGLYACGWDLITSPAGLLFVWKNVPAGERSEALWGALRAPRVAVTAYFRDALQLSEPEIRRAERRALAVAGVMFGIFLLFALGSAFWFIFSDELGL